MDVNATPRAFAGGRGSDQHLSRACRLKLRQAAAATSMRLPDPAELPFYVRGRFDPARKS
jgi:hypothetical protein